MSSVIFPFDETWRGTLSAIACWAGQLDTRLKDKISCPSFSLNATDIGFRRRRNLSVINNRTGRRQECEKRLKNRDVQNGRRAPLPRLLETRYALTSGTFTWALFEISVYRKLDAHHEVDMQVEVKRKES
ncbi:dicarboxylic amino acid permease, partial [Moniliophthora roreri]